MASLKKLFSYSHRRDAEDAEKTHRQGFEVLCALRISAVK